MEFSHPTKPFHHAAGRRATGGGSALLPHTRARQGVRRRHGRRGRRAAVGEEAGTKISEEQNHLAQDFKRLSQAETAQVATWEEDRDSETLARS